MREGRIPDRFIVSGDEGLLTFPATVLGEQYRWRKVGFWDRLALHTAE